MTAMRTTFATAMLVICGSGGASAACAVTEGSVRILANDFPALHSVMGAARECETDALSIEVNMTADHKDIQVAALTADPAQYTVAFAANGSIVPLLNADLVRPLDDLIAEFAPDLPETNKVRIDGKTVAIAFMANAQHLFYRADILREAGLEPPETYEDMIAAARAIEEQGILDHPIALNTGVGWNVGLEFVNIYLGAGGELFEPGTARPAIANETGVRTLELMKAASELADPDFLTFDSNVTQAIWEAGDAAFSIMWGSRAATLLDDEGASAEVIEATTLTGAPSIGDGALPASTLWWDGFTIARNASDADTKASFATLIHGISEDMVRANNDEAVWLSPVFEPGRAAIGVAETAGAGARPYPVLPYMGLLHTAIGNNLAAFLQGSESAEDALADIEAAYTSAAAEQGFVQ